MEIFDKSKRQLYIMTKEQSLKQLSTNVNKLNQQELTSKFDTLKFELSYLKRKLENMTLIPDFDWDNSVKTIDQLEQEIKQMTNIALMQHERQKTK